MRALAENAFRRFQALAGKRETTRLAHASPALAPTIPEKPPVNQERIIRVGEGIEHLYAQVAFRPILGSTPAELYFVLSTEDIAESAPKLYSALALGQANVSTVEVGIDAGRTLETLYNIRTAGVVVTVSEATSKETGKLIRDVPYINIAIASQRRLDQQGPDDNDPALTFSRYKPEGAEPYGSREDLETEQDLNDSEGIVGELNTTVKNLRGEFITQQEQQAQALLNPRQRALVETLVEEGRRIREQSYTRGFYDEFLIAGVPNRDGKLEEIYVVFSAASDTGNSDWQSPSQFDALKTSWKSRGKDVRGSIMLLSGPIGEDQKYEMAVVRRSDNRMQEIVQVLFGEAQREGVLHPTVSETASLLFQRFLAERVGIEFTELSPVILATSISLS